MADILHISDLHFGPPYLPKVGEALLRSAEDLSPDIVVASGDFTYRAREEEFLAAKEFLGRLPDVPKVVTPGNHDVPKLPRLSRLFTPFARYRRHIRPELNFDLAHAGAAIVSLNSTSWFGSATEGWLEEGQLKYAAEVFAEAPEESLRVVVAHHHLAPAPDFKGGEVMHFAKRAIEHFVSLKVDLILGGHLHRAYIGNSLDFYPGVSRDHGIILVQCGTSTSRRGRVREREKNTFNLIRPGPDTIEVTHYMYFSEADGFEIISQHFFPRAGAKYVRQGVRIQALARE